MQMFWMKHRFSLVSVCVVALLLGTSAYLWQAQAAPTDLYRTPQEADPYVRFDMEAYDAIQQKYWNKAADADMATLFQLSVAKAANLTVPPTLVSKDRAGVAQMLGEQFKLATTTELRKQLALNTIIIALANLAPTGRSGLLSSGQEVQLRQTVANVDPGKDLYADLGVQKGASESEVAKAYEEKKAVLATATTSEAQAELQKITYAKVVLTNSDTKARYDTAQIEPTVFSKILGKTLYVSMSKISPTTLQEFGRTVDTASTTPGLGSLILDLRGNIGGALDFATSFLGLFVGHNQYAYDLFQQGNYLPQRTTIGKFEQLTRYKEVALLTDNMTQSTAEVITAMFKRFHLGVVIGAPTRGWGSVENTIPLKTSIDPKETYSILLVQYLTVRDDGQEIEGKGVDPDISLSDANWKTALPQYLRSQSLMSALLQTAGEPPLR